ncbi:hypothetical protein CPB86DRAFT_876900 [Serendipita vermifera]|nr:hypothetical protein CPB86DRAFT_876900 [Serendipita vermifera]
MNNITSQLSLPPAQPSTNPLPPFSEEFPQGYGDLILSSSDGVIFHFPSFLLSHASPVFRDMYRLGEGTQNQEALNLTEDHLTLERFLCHIDPVKDVPHLDWDRVPGVLQAAEKYQVNSIFKWFEREVSLSMTATHYPTLPNPMLYFTLVRRYDLRVTEKLALRQLIKCPLSEITGSPHVDSSLLKGTYILRISRSQWLMDVIDEYSNDLFASGCRHSNGVTIHYGSSRDWKSFAKRAIVAEPSWSAIVTSVTNIVQKGCGCLPLQGENGLKDKVMEKEAELPELRW